MRIPDVNTFVPEVQQVAGALVKATTKARAFSPAPAPGAGEVALRTVGG